MKKSLLITVFALITTSQLVHAGTKDDYRVFTDYFGKAVKAQQIIYETIKFASEKVKDSKEEKENEQLKKENEELKERIRQQEEEDRRDLHRFCRQCEMPNMNINLDGNR